jgi:hypothetical protein
MANYHAKASCISRSGKQSSMSNAAYICAEKATDMRTGMQFSYKNKASEVAYKNILLPEGMGHLDSTEKLWNAVEKFEDVLAEERYGNHTDPVKLAKSLAAKEKYLAEASTSFCLEASLPIELSLEEKKELSDLIAKQVFGSKSLIVQYAIHDKKGNPHVHYAANFRPVIDGEFSKQKYRFRRSDIKEIRKFIADITNNYAKEKGYNFVIDHRSYVEQGIKIEPTKHLGWMAAKLGDESRIVLENKEILSRNAALLLESPEEAVKVLIQNKTIFNLGELKSAFKEKFGVDRQGWYVLEELIKHDNSKELIERANKFGNFLEISHCIREDALAPDEGISFNEDNGDSIKSLRADRGVLASEILEKIDDYKWLMSRVGMRDDTLSSLASVEVAWNDRAEFVGSDLPEDLKAGDTLSSLAKLLGSKLDDGIVSVFNLENLGKSFKGRDAYITRQDLGREKDIIETRSKLQETGFGDDLSLSVRLLKRRPSDNISAVIKSQEKQLGYKFSDEQKAAAMSLVQNNAYAALIGKAGTGKTTTLRCVAATYQKAGFRVIGTSFQGAAVGELGASLGKYMDSGFTLSKLAKEWRSIDKDRGSDARASLYELSEKTVIIVDEAAMAPRYLLQALMDRAMLKKSKIISVGDGGQISSIDRADISRLLLDGGVELGEVRRQKNDDDASASNDFAKGHIKAGIESYIARDKVEVRETDFSSKLSLVHHVSDKIASDGAFKHMLIAYKNADVNEFNISVQRVLKENGVLLDKGITVLTGFSSLKSEQINEILSNEAVKNTLLKIRGNVTPIKENSISYGEACLVLARTDAGSKEHQLLTDAFKPKRFYGGDKIRFTSNYNKGIEGETVYNGSLGVIKFYNANTNQLMVAFENGKRTKVDLADYHSLDLGYAVTINSSQGKTAENTHLYLSNTNGAKIGSKEFYVGATRHSNNLTIHTSKEYLGDKELYQKIGERWKMTAADLKDNPELELVYKIEKASNDSRSLWCKMQKDVRGAKCDLWDHGQFGEYKLLKEKLSILGSEAKANWGQVRIYASEAGITLDDVERFMGNEDKIPEEDSDLIEYRKYRDSAQKSWVNIIKTKKSTPTEHEGYARFKEGSSKRNELAYKLASFGNEQHIHDRSGKAIITHQYNHVDKSEWKKIQRHSDLYIKDQVSAVKKSDNTNKDIKPNQNKDINKDKRQSKSEKYQAIKAEWENQHEQLRSAIRLKAEYIAKDLLGEPNKQQTSKNELRFGEHGKLSVRITGDKAGTWYDFSKGEGGDLFDLVSSVRGGDFKNTSEYLRNSVGISSSTLTRENLSLVGKDTRSVENKSREDEEKENQAKEEKAEIAKAAYVNKLHARSKDIGNKSIANQYLSGARSINIHLSLDIRTTGIYDAKQQVCFPALVAFARDKDGNITGGQHLLLDKETKGKADIEVPKKSFGSISGSFVDLGHIGNKTILNNNAENTIADTSKKSDITIIAEGIETGLSVKQAMYEHSQKGDDKAVKYANINIKTLCSLGISNIKNYTPSKGEKIIIAADNDGVGSITARTIEYAKSALESKGAFVEIVKPEKQGDFNDILRDKENGCGKVIADCFKTSIAKHSAKTLGEYIANTSNTDDSDKSSGAKNQHLSTSDRTNLTIIQKYNISQENILNAWRSNPGKGKEEITSTALEISLTEKRLEGNRDILDLAANYGIKVDEAHLVKTLFMSPASSEQECMNHILSGFAKQKQESVKIGDLFNIINKEDKFLSEVKLNNNKELESNLQDRVDLSKSKKSQDIIASIKQNIEANHKQGIISYDDLLNKVVASGYDIKGLDAQLKSLADENRSSGLFAIYTELEELCKIGYSYDPDKILGDFRSMSYEEKKNYGKNLLHKEMTKYLEHNLIKYSQDRKNANNTGQSIKAILEESKAHAKLYDKHTLGIHAVDKVNGNARYILLTKSAYDLHNKYKENEITDILNYSLKNNITDIESIKNTLNDNGGNFKKAYDPIRIQYNLNQAKQVEASTTKITPERSFYYPITLSFDNKPTDGLEKTIGSLGMRFNKFRQEWYGDVKEQHLTKLTKSIENYKHDIDIRPKEEYGKSSKQEKQSEIKIDKGFSM